MTRILKNLGISLAALLIMCPLSQVFGQGREITGTVTGYDTKQPVAGVTVTVKGTKKAVVTDAQGHFRITVDNNAKALVFSSAGYVLQEMDISGKNSVNLEMLPEVKQMEDVVVIGYQTVKRKDVLASVSSVSAKDLKDIPINSAAEALNGRLAGVTATTAEGSPDADVRIRVRGGMSITGDNSPLYVIDGVEVENALNVLSPQDIQSIDVLKDAAATAIYGARGANGVIIITTKSGRAGRPVVSYNGFVGVKMLAKKLKVLTPYDFVFYQSERSRGSGSAPNDSTRFADNFGHTWDTLQNYKTIFPIDWQEENFGQTGYTTSHNVSVSGGNKKVTYNFGYTYNDDKAIVINSNYKRHLLNAKADYRITSKIKAGTGFRYYHQEVYGAGVSDAKGSQYNRLRNAVKYRPFLSNGFDIDENDPIADPAVGNGLSLYNPIQLANSEYRRKTTEAFNFTAYASYQILKNLSFKSTLGYDWNRVTDRQFNDSITPYAITQGGRKPIAGLDTTTKTTINNSNVFTYSIKGWKNDHDLDILIGEETYDLRTEIRSELFKSYPLNTSPKEAFTNTGLGTSFTGYPRLKQMRYTSLSFFGRINYSYKDKYLLSANVRQDGASKFAPDKRWGTFPAGSVAWRVKNEKFMENVDFINDLKFRASYGTIGNNRIADYLYLPNFSSDGKYYYGINNQAVLAYYPSSLPNENLQWESTISRNYGLDLSLFKGRVDLSFDIYNNTSGKLLLDVPIDPTYGTPITSGNTVPTQIQNIGKTSNKGVEIQLNAVILRKQNALNWNANFNISFNKNKILALGVNQKFFSPAASWGVSGQPTDYIEMLGQPVGSFWGLVQDGFYKVSDFDYNPAKSVYTLKAGTVSDSSIIGTVQPGSIKFKDLNGDGKVDLNNDRKIIGNPNPKFTGGLSQQFSYKNWDASIFVNFSFGNDVYNANKIELTNAYSVNSNMLAIMSGRWKVVTPTGQTAQFVISKDTVWGIPPDQLTALNAGATIWQPLKAGNGAFYPSSWAIEDGSFLRINNITIGYSLPVKKLARLKMTKLRFYITANNLAIVTNYSGYDPEVSVRSNPLTPGLDYSAYPKSRSFIVGINATF